MKLGVFVCTSLFIEFEFINDGALYAKQSDVNPTRTLVISRQRRMKRVSGVRVGA
jgi:hypothetical protein